MKCKLKTSRKACVFEFLTAIPLIAFSLVSFSVLKGRLLLLVFYSLLLCIALFVFGMAVYNVQIAEIDGGCIKVKNISGTVKTLKLNDIEKAVIVDAVYFSFKGLRLTEPSVALSHKKSFRVGEVEGAANSKKRGYIIIPYTESNVKALKEAYRETVGEELVLTF